MNFQQFKTTAQISGALSIIANLENCGKNLNQTDFGLNSEAELTTQEHKRNNELLDKIFPIDETNSIHLNEVKTNYLEKSDIILFQNFEMEIDYKINKIRAIPLILKTASFINDNNDKSIARNFLVKESQLVMEKLVKHLPVKELSENKINIEEQFKLNLQNQLDSILGKDTLKIKNAKIVELYLGQSKNLVESLKEDLIDNKEFKAIGLKI